MEEEKIFEDAKEIIHPQIYKFIYVLFKYIFFGKKSINDDIYLKLQKFVERLNKKGFKINLNVIEKNRKDKDKKEIIQNINIIFEFVKSQNLVYASEIIENIIIIVISLGYKVDKSDIFGKYIYSDLENLYSKKRNKISNWINNEDLKDFLNFNDIIEIDIILESGKEKQINQYINNKNLLVYLLLRLYFLKKIKSKLDDISGEKGLSDETSIYSLISNIFYHKYDFGIKIKDNKIGFGALSSLFISVYIYYYNKHNPLINYTKEKENLAKVPFTYELSEAGICNKFLNIIIPPIRIEPRIEIIEMNENRFEAQGMLELYKAIIFNKNIKKISINNCTIKSKYLKEISQFFSIFTNDNVEILDMKLNYLNSDVDAYLAQLISSLRGLKTLNLSDNNLKCGAASLFVTLKNLYRQKKTKLESLILINCQLDDISFYELGELLKSKYCMLKYLCINFNLIPSDVEFFKSLKKNKSLKEIYLYDCGINNDKKDEIDRIISNTNIEVLYLAENNIHDINDIIRIIYRNTLIKYNEKNFECETPCLYNLNLSQNECYNNNIEKLELIKAGFENINLSCLDLVYVLYEKNKYKKYKEKKEEDKKDKDIKGKEISDNIYYEQFENINKFLSEKAREYKKALDEVINNKVAQENIKNELTIDEKNDLKKYEEKIKEIINNTKSKFSSFIIQKAKQLINNRTFESKEEKNIFLNKLIKYINLKRAEKIIDENEKIKKKKKMILI